MKKVLFILFAFSFSSALALKGGDPVLVKEKEKTDTIPFEIDEEEIAENTDSLSEFPAYGLYSNWDTVHTHSAKFNVETLKEQSREIVLSDESSCGYVHPIAGTVTSGFGPRKKRFHYGADIDLETGDEVVSAFDGKVRIARKSKTYGNVVVIRHNNGLETYYAHLSQLNVEVGEEVFAGQSIGLGGNTGRSRGSHLHFEVRYLGQPINPSEIISFTEHKLVTDTLCLSSETFNYIKDAEKVASKYNSKNSKGKVYVIKKGDTLYSLAKRYHTTPKAISKQNGIKVTSTLRPGQKLKL